ncbi:MAG TPA: type II secretion system major pseudopilin GspG [Gemmatimonadaceae bacterium]|nr:type II secretion system major pseudopilin GspG [Gemmatimonadaceae bacterium]
MKQLRSGDSLRLRRGLTLIELVVVLIVIGLLAGLVAPQILGRVSDARVTTAKTQIELLGVALENYHLDNGVYPSSQQGLGALRAKPSGMPEARNWRGPYLKKDVPVDPWGHPYIYRSPGEKDRAGFDVQTLGRDGKPGGTDEDADLSSG